MLGNPRYVTNLFDLGYFFDQEFKDYISSLKCYLKKPRLMKMIKFPEGLYNLEIMLKAGFIEIMEDENLRKKFIIECLKRNLEFKSGYRRWKNLTPL